MSLPPVGRSDDRRLIVLVKQRPALYARCTLPVASYYRQVKLLWKEVAEEMGAGVAEVRRKWSHVRNSYSRQLRNELQRACTGTGRAVSRWHLADELEFLRPHMATDRRSSAAAPECSWPRAALAVKAEPDTEPRTYADDSSNSCTFESEENAAYFQFFRGIFHDYRELGPRKQRQFRRQCLHLLHRLLDQSDGDGDGDGDPPDPPDPEPVPVRALPKVESGASL